MNGSNLIFIASSLAAGIFAIGLWIYFGRRKTRDLKALHERDEIAIEARQLKQEIAFYTHRKTELEQRAQKRRQLSTVARELGSLLDPAQVQEKLLTAAQALFPHQPVQISHGTGQDPIESYVIKRRQPVLVPSDLFKGIPLMAAPISVQRSVAGILRVGGTDASAAPYSRDDLRLLDVLANLASLAMDNCLLFNQVRENALRDHLTGLYTHRAFQDQLESAVLEASRYRQPLSLVSLDVDHFKSINDTLGHQAGDEILQGVAHVLDRNVRDIDIIARTGGEEFCVLLLQTDHTKALVLAEQIRADLAGQGFEFNGEVLSVTASFGVSTFPEDATSGQQLVREADQRLYKAKHGGRNQVRGRSR